MQVRTQPEVLSQRVSYSNDFSLRRRVTYEVFGGRALTARRAGGSFLQAHIGALPVRGQGLSLPIELITATT